MQVEQWLWQSFRYQRSAIRIQTLAKFYKKYDLQLTVEKTKLTKKEAGSGAFKNVQFIHSWMGQLQLPYDLPRIQLLFLQIKSGENYRAMMLRQRVLFV